MTSATSSPRQVSQTSNAPKKLKFDRTYYWMTVPAAIIFAFFLYLPFVQGVLYSFTNSQGFGSYKWIGFKNYGALFQDSRVWHAYGFSIFIAVVCSILINLIAMFLAVLLNSRIAFKNGFRAIFFIPYTLAVLVIGYVFKYIFMVPLPALGQALHIGWLSESMITNAQLAWVPIVFLTVWQSVAYNTLLYLAGLQTIDQEVYEAAEIDGANAWQGFHRRRERLAELLADHLPLVGTFRDHQRRPLPEEHSGGLRPDRRFDRRRP